MAVNSTVDQVFSLDSGRTGDGCDYTPLLHGRGAEVRSLNLVWLAIVLATPIFAGSITRSPTTDGGATCDRTSSAQCTFKVTCASETCTRGESDQYQTVLNEAQLGDTIQLEAGRTFPAWARMGFSTRIRVTARAI